MNVTAMAYGLIQLRFGQDAEWLARVEKSATRLKDMAQQIHYDFNSQGYDFAKAAALPTTTSTAARCRRWLQLRDADGVEAYRERAISRRGQDRHRPIPCLPCEPWYEVPSGAMAVMAAAKLESMGHPADTRKALGFVSIPSGADGEWALGRTRGQRADGRFLD